MNLSDYVQLQGKIAEVPSIANMAEDAAARALSNIECYTRGTAQEIHVERGCPACDEPADLVLHRVHD
jgi:hypothetical protein